MDMKNYSKGFKEAPVIAWKPLKVISQFSEIICGYVCKFPFQYQWQKTGHKCALSPAVMTFHNISYPSPEASCRRNQPRFKAWIWKAIYNLFRIIVMEFELHSWTSMYHTQDLAGDNNNYWQLQSADEEGRTSLPTSKKQNTYVLEIITSKA